jgi:hypothetical protein
MPTAASTNARSSHADLCKDRKTSVTAADMVFGESLAVDCAGGAI